MAALAADRLTATKESKEKSLLLAAAKVYRGGLVNLNAAGYAKPAADVADERCVGVSLEQVDNAAGAAGDKRVIVEAGKQFKLAVTGAFTQADIGKKCFVVDDQTVQIAVTTNAVVAGFIAGFISATEAWVEIPNHSGKGVTDAAAGGTYTAAEQALINKMRTIINTFAV